MRTETIKTGIAVAWVAVTCAVAASAGVSTASGWLLFAVVAALPPIAMWRLWHEPDQTMSESIDQARR